jgi:hypothetical protein
LRVTFTRASRLLAAESATVICPVCTPAASAEPFTDASSRALCPAASAPSAGRACSQGRSSEAVQLSMAVPVLERTTRAARVLAVVAATATSSAAAVVLPSPGSAEVKCCGAGGSAQAAAGAASRPTVRTKVNASEVGLRVMTAAEGSTVSREKTSRLGEPVPMPVSRPAVEVAFSCAATAAGSAVGAPCR